MDRDTFYWKVQIAQTITHEKRFAKVMQSLFARQEKEILSKITNKRLLKLSTVTKAKDIDLYIDSVALDEDKWNRTFIESTTPLYKAVVATAGAKVFTDLALGIDFDINTDDVNKFIKNKTIKFSGFVNGETNNKLNKIIKPILEKGGSVNVVAERIRKGITKSFDGSVRSIRGRSQTIARTEMVGAGNGGGLEAAKQSKVVKSKAWITSRDHKVRESHQKAGRKYTRSRGIPIDKPFKVGTALLSVPGVAVGGFNVVKEIANCRCTWIPVRVPKGKKKQLPDIEIKAQTLPNVPFFSMRRIDEFLNEISTLYGDSHLDSLMDDFEALLRRKTIGDSGITLLEIKEWVFASWSYDADTDLAGLVRHSVAHKYMLHVTAHDDRYMGEDAVRQATYFGTINKALTELGDEFGIESDVMEKNLSMLIDYIQAYSLFAFRKMKRKNITLYRGVVDPYFKNKFVGRPMKLKGKSVQTNSLSSWSANREVAEESLIINGGGYILKLSTSIKNVFNSYLIDKTLDPHREEVILRQRKKGYVIREVERVKGDKE